MLADRRREVFGRGRSTTVRDWIDGRRRSSPARGLSAITDNSQPPREMANVAPLDIGGAGQTRLIVEAVKESVADLKSDVKDIKSYRFGDLFKYLSALAAAVVLLGSMMIAVYFKIEDQIHTLRPHRLELNRSSMT